MTDEILSRKQAAQTIKVGLRTLDRQIDLPRVKLSARRIGYRRSDLMAWIESRADVRASA